MTELFTMMLALYGQNSFVTNKIDSIAFKSVVSFKNADGKI
jgi:hypothetical protein